METGFTFTLTAWQLLMAGAIAGFVARGWFARWHRIGRQQQIDRDVAKLKAEAEKLMALAKPAGDADRDDAAEAWQTFGRSGGAPFGRERAPGSADAPDGAKATRRRPRA